MRYPEASVNAVPQLPERSNLAGSPTEIELSVIICTYNRSQSLRRALCSLEAMLVASGLSWEVIVVDNNSRDDTRQVVEEFASTSRLNVRYVFEGTQGLNPARDRGVKEARGEIVSFIDDDVIVTGDWLTQVKKAFDEYSAACVGGRVILADDVPRPSWWDRRFNGALGECDLGDAVIIADEDYPGTVGIGANISFRRSVLDRYGLFKTGLGRVGKKLFMGEDTEYYLRLKKAGELAIYHPSAVVYHCPRVERLTRQYLGRWYFRFGEWHSLLDHALADHEEMVKIFGVPRTMFRSASVNCLNAIFEMLRGRANNAFYYVLQLVAFSGYVCGLVKRKPR